MPQPGDVVAAFGSVWVQSRADGALWRIDPTGGVTARLRGAAALHGDPRLGSWSIGLAAGFGSVWSLTNDALLRIDPASGHVDARVAISSPRTLAVGAGAVWVVCCRSQITLLRIDPSTLRADVFARVGTSIGAVAVAEGSIWLMKFSEGGGMFKIDAASGAIEDLQVGYNDRSVVATPRWLWLVDDGQGERIDPSDGSPVDPRPQRKAPRSIGASYSHGTVWINSGTAVGVDAVSGAVTDRLPGFTDVKWWWTGGIAQLGRRVWIADPGSDRVLGLPLTSG